MQKIKLLSPQEIHKIAAGQVVDRPANVVKELVENAIDAGATQISIHIKDGGRELIAVADNGCGMSPADARFCFKEHATSKIQSISDLHTISTFGFRGEALSSISAVSQLTLTTKEQDAAQGIQLELEAGTIVKESEVPFSVGTELSIRTLFYNVPARQKFLKKRETENRHITQLFHSFCIDYLHIHFKLFQEEKLALNCPPVQDIVSRLTQLWDHTFSQNMIPIEAEHKAHKIKLYGAISNHQYVRYDRNNIFLFVNKRWVRNNQISSALLKGYMNVLPPGKFPAAYILLEVDPSEVDVNIHPRKEEVKFLHPGRIAALVRQEIKRALENHLSSQIKKEVTFVASDDRPQQIPSVQPFSSIFDSDPFPDIATPFVGPKNNKQFVSFDYAPQSGKQSMIQNQIPSQVQESQEKEQVKIVQKNYELIGQYKKTYILLEKKDGMFIVDQHAAHERVLYEIFSQRFTNVATVQLMFPQIIHLNSQEITCLNKPHYMDIFKKNGIEIEIFGENQLIVQATPVHIKNINLEELVKQVIAWIAEFQELDQEEFFKAIHERMHAQMACKAAVKAGDVLAVVQMEQLLEDLGKSPNNLTCPHGRPTGWLLSNHEIEKKFKRKL